METKYIVGNNSVLGKGIDQIFFVCNLSSISLGKVSSVEPFLKRGGKKTGEKELFQKYCDQLALKEK